MAHEDDISYKLDYDLSTDELYEVLDELMIEYKKVKTKSKETIFLNQELSKQVELVIKEKDDLTKENQKLNLKIEKLEKLDNNLTNKLEDSKKN